MVSSCVIPLIVVEETGSCWMKPCAPMQSILCNFEVVITSIQEIPPSVEGISEMKVSTESMAFEPTALLKANMKSRLTINDPFTAQARTYQSRSSQLKYPETQNDSVPGVICRKRG